MDIQSIIGSVAIGKDTSGNFKQSMYGLAVRTTADGKFIAHHKNEYVDVTGLTLDGTENLIYRLPVKKPLYGDIIIRADNPFSVLFVEKVHDHGGISGFDPATGDVIEYRPIGNMLNFHFFVKVVGPYNLLDKKDSNELLPLMLLGNQSTGTNSPDALSSLFLLKSLGKEGLEDNSMLPLLLLSSQNKGGSDSLALMLAMRGNKFFEKLQEGEEEKDEAKDEAKQPGSRKKN